jgi:hypothetical protein
MQGEQGEGRGEAGEPEFWASVVVVFVSSLFGEQASEYSKGRYFVHVVMVWVYVLQDFKIETISS